MAITISTESPASLLQAIRNAIDDGRVRTWEYDRDGDLTHVPQQWRQHAWLRPSVREDSLVFNIVAPANRPLSTEDYAVYHGRFIEMLLAHFDSQFNSARATALPTSADWISEQGSALFR